MLLGVDLSHYQGRPDFSQIVAAGKTFAFLKALDGLAGVDVTFSGNRAAAKAAGLAVGAYAFFRPQLDAVAQADAFCRVVGDVPAGELPPMIDVEEALTNGVNTWTAIPTEQRVADVCAWVSRIETNLGRTPVVYTRTDIWTNFMGNSPALSRCPLWLAQYHTPVPDDTAAQTLVPHLPAAWSTWTFLQYTGAGKCPGVAGPVDLDVFNGDAAALQALTQPSTTC